MEITVIARASEAADEEGKKEAGRSLRRVSCSAQSVT